MPRPGDDDLVTEGGGLEEVRGSRRGEEAQRGWAKSGEKEEPRRGGGGGEGWLSGGGREHGVSIDQRDVDMGDAVKRAGSASASREPQNPP